MVNKSCGIEKKRKNNASIKKLNERKKMNEQEDKIGEENIGKWEMKGQGHLAFHLPQHYLYPL
jgi:hypothetical protein